MSRYDFAAQRLFVDAPLADGARIALSREQANYLLNVLRLGAGDSVIVFNGREGEWRAVLADTGRKAASLDVTQALRAQEAGPDLDYLFAPLKHARLDYMVQKAVEMGAALDERPTIRLLVVCDEDAPMAEAVAALRERARPGAPIAVLIGPEGGFDPSERAMLMGMEQTLTISLGPRILRADTAAVAALAVVHAALGG